MFIFLLIIINLLGTLLGFFYYKEQIFASSPLYWLFIPDCPIYTLLFALSSLFALYSFRPCLFNYITSVGLLKYGFWTVFVILFYHSTFLTGEHALFYTILLFLHIGMGVEGLLIIPKKIKKEFLILTISWFLLNDFFDYGIGTYPSTLPPYGIEVVAGITFLSSIFFSFAVYYLAKKNFKPAYL